MKSLLVAVLLLVFSTGCKKSEDKLASLSATEEVASASEPMAIKLPPKEDRAAGDSQSPTVYEQKIIKDGNLRFETPDLDETYARIAAAVRKHSAQIQNDVTGKDYESVFRNITVRIPNKNFDVFVAEIGKGVSYFDRKEISARDVTEEYIDLDARLKAKKVLETRYLELLKKAAKVSEILEIEKQLAAVREEIEAKEGQLRYLESHVAMSTVTIEFYRKTAMESGATVSYGSKMWTAIKSGFNGISAFFIGLLYIWPFIVILVALTFFLRRRFRKKTT
jgi:hypothetical protein